MTVLRTSSANYDTVAAPQRGSLAVAGQHTVLVMP